MSARYRHQSQWQEDAEQRSERNQGGHLTEREFNAPFQTGERKLSVKQLNYFEQGEENAMNPEGTNSGDDVHYWSEDTRGKLLTF